MRKFDLAPPGGPSALACVPSQPYPGKDPKLEAPPGYQRCPCSPGWQYPITTTAGTGQPRGARPKIRVFAAIIRETLIPRYSL